MQNKKIIDLRSDTFTKPCLSMRKAIFDAKVGDDVYKEDPTINELEKLGAKITGKKAALFTSSGTQSNLIALLTHCRRGDEYITGQTAHTYKFEGGGAAVFGSIQPQPIDFELNGTLSLDKIQKAIKPKDFHFANTKLICLENTQNGLALPLDYLFCVKKFAKKHSLKTHLDGARVFNASIKLKTTTKKIANNFDSISICLSKGLGAPIGSLLCSDKKFISKARRWRKVLGGGMRQAGIIANAGIFALKNNIKRLAQDHTNAKILANALKKIDGLKVEYDLMQTNMVFVQVKKCHHNLKNQLKQKNILINANKKIRMVTHLDITKDDIHYVIEQFNFFLK